MKIQMSTAKILFIISKISKRIWVTAFLYAFIGVVFAFIALFVKNVIPEELSSKVGIATLENILTILASSMLAVATFSLSIMVIAFGNVSTNATPRATSLIIENQNAQRAVATFIGAFLYSIVGIIALATHSYGNEGRFVLFLVTIIVIIAIVITLIKWVDQLSTIGQVGNTIAEIEKATLEAIKEHAERPYLGGVRLEIDTFLEIELIAVRSQEVGFVVFIDTKSIQKICDDYDFTISLSVLPGSFIYPNQTLAMLSKSVDKECLKSIISQFVIESERNFKQDPQYGFLLLSEIASRALSQGINDPGTALDAISSGTRILKIRTDLIRKASEQSKAPLYSRVFVPPLQADELITTLITPIARDGSAKFEVGVKIQKTLMALKNYALEYQIVCDLLTSFTKEHFNITLKTQFEKDLVENANKTKSEKHLSN